MSENSLALFFSPPIAKRALVVAVVAGTLLTIVNQWQGLFGEEHIDWTKVVLTYCVPYLVSSASSFLSVRSQLKEDSSS